MDNLSEIFVFLFNVSFNYGYSQSSFCGELPPHQATSTDPDLIYYDRFGNSYDIIPQGNNIPIPTTMVQVGNFNLIFPQNVFSQSEIDVCTDVFEYLNNILVQRQVFTNCGVLVNNAEINIDFQKIIFSDNDRLGTASGLTYGKIDYCQDGIELTYSTIYQKLNGLSRYSNNSSIDGIIAISQVHSDNNQFFTGYPDPQTGDQFDLFTVVLHEAMHLITFSPTISDNLFVTPYDLLINGQAGNMLDCAGKCYHNNYNPISTFQPTIGSNNILLGANDNLSHLAGASYLMHGGLALGERKFLSSDEILITCETGLQTTSCDGQFIDIINSGNSSGIACTELDGCCTNTFITCQNSISIPIEEINCRLIHNFTNFNVIGVETIVPSLQGLVTFDGTNIQANRNMNLQRYEVVVTYEVVKSNGDCVNFNAIIEVIFELNCDCEFLPTNECINTLCYHDFESTIPESWVTFGLPFYFENTPQCNNVSADLVENNGNTFLDFPNINETVVLSIHDAPYNFCNLNLQFDGRSDIGAQAEIWGSSVPPCDINDRGVSRNCGEITTCGDGSVFQSQCLGTITISSSGFQSYDLNILTSQFDQPINYIFIINSSEQPFAIDNISLRVTNCALDAEFVEENISCGEFKFNPTQSNNQQTHFWNFGDGTTSTESNPSHTYSTNGTYEVWHLINDNCGNSIDFKHVIIVDCICNEPIASFTNIVTCEGSLNFVSFTFTGTGEGLTYTWDFGDGTSSTDQNPSHVYSSNGTYTVTLSISDGCGHTTTFSSNVVVNCRTFESRCDSLILNTRYITIDCGNTPLLWSQYAATHGISNNFSPFLAYLKGTLIIDEPITFGNFLYSGEWIMSDGAELIVENHLTVFNTHFKGCITMWEGITVNNGGSLTIAHNSIVEDANNGIFINGGSASIQNVTFINNVIGVNAVDHFPNSPNICSFKCSGNLKPPYFGQMGYPADGLSYAGIKLDNTGSFYTGTIQDPRINTFDGLRNGIIGINTNLQIYENNFINMRGAYEDDTATSPELSGYAIVASGGSNYTIQENIISGVKIGVSINNAVLSNIKIRDNRISNFNTTNAYGIKCQNNLGGTIDANSNIINNGYSSIYFLNNNGSINRIYSNIITNDQIDENASEIVLSCTSCSEFGTAIHNNNIIRSRAYFGIASLHVNKNRIYNNNINLTGIVGQEGILISNASETYMHDNNITGTNPLGRAVQTFQSPSSRLECNWVDNLQTGFFFYGMSPGTNFKSNLMNNQSSNGLELDHALIGVQSHKSNVWYGSTRRAKSQFSSLQFNRFLVDPVLQPPYIPGLINGTFKPTTNPSNGWFFYEYGFENTCWDGAFEPEALQDPGANLSAMIDAEGSDTGYDAYNRWFLEKEALGYMDSHQTVSFDKDLEMKYEQAEQGLKNLANLENVINTAFLPLEQENIAMQSIFNAIDLKSSQIFDILSDPDYTSNSSLVEHLHLLKNELEALNTELQSQQNGQKARFASEALAIKIRISAIPNDTEYARDYKDALTAWVDYYVLGKPYVMQHHLSKLQQIAEKCILDNGEGVTMARNVLLILGIPMQYFDACNPTESRIRVSTEAKAIVSISPNPASTTVDIRIAGDETITEVNAIAADGQLYYAIKQCQDLHNIDISNWTSGLYVLKFRLSSGKEEFIKLVKL
ncbi:MAG: PKD domain-containing protein [Saprospiraceae bacterium]